MCAALLVLSIAALACARLFGVALGAIAFARFQTSATILAAQKLEQLRSLSWRFSGAGPLVAVGDSSTDLTQDPATGNGPGLASSPASSLATNTPGFVDFLDKTGQWVGTGQTPPASAVFIRRWSVASLPGRPNSLVLRVLVTTITGESKAILTLGRRRLAGDAMVATMVTRKAE